MAKPIIMFNRLKQLFCSISILSLVMIVTVGLISFLFIDNYLTEKRNLEEFRRQIQVEKLKGEIELLSEILFSSTRMAAATGDMKWLDKYFNHVPPLEERIAEGEQLTHPRVTNFYEERTAQSLEYFVRAEKDILAAITENRPEDAERYYTSDEYHVERAIYYADAMEFTTAQDLSVRLSQLAATMRYVDEVLTNSANLMAATGDPDWRGRYDETGTHFTRAIAEAQLISPDDGLADAIAYFEEANDVLVDIEFRSFELAEEGSLAEAQALMGSDEYAAAKAKFTVGINKFVDRLDELVLINTTQEETNLKRLALISSLIIFALLSSWIFIVVSIQRQRKIIIEKNDLLCRVNEDLEQFAYRSSHDLKAPLSTVKGLARFIKADIDSGNLEEARANTVKVENQVSKLENLVIDLLNLAKADLTNEDRTAVDFQTMLRDIEDQLAEPIAKNDVVVETHVKTARSIFSQKTRILQILENLILNAVKYSDPEKEKRWVKVDVTQNTEFFQITVADNGIGIPKDKQQDVFQLFKRFHPGRSDGSGLGMSLIKRHVDRLGGKISFDSSPEGSTFNLSFPLYQLD